MHVMRKVWRWSSAKYATLNTNMAKVLVVGSGGREHAIAYKFHKEGHEVHMAGINPAVEEFGVCVALTEDQIPSYAKTNSIDLVFVGPEVPLVNGLVDELQKEGIRAFGPSKLAAQLEGSKVFSKMMMRKYNIPTAKYESFNDYEQAKEYLSKQKAPIVLKADGLAAGKGVIIANTLEEAQHELKEMMCNAKFNKAGSSVVIEEFLQGEEFSLMCFVSDRKVYPMEIAQDHKRAFDNDEGLNTGGMGAYLPLKKITQDDIDEGVRNVVQPMVDLQQPPLNISEPEPIEEQVINEPIVVASVQENVFVHTPVSTSSAMGVAVETDEVILELDAALEAGPSSHAVDKGK